MDLFPLIRKHPFTNRDIDYKTNECICRTFTYQYQNKIWESITDNVRIPVNNIMGDYIRIIIDSYTIKSIPTSVKHSILKSLL